MTERLSLVRNGASSVVVHLLRWHPRKILPNPLPIIELKWMMIDCTQQCIICVVQCVLVVDYVPSLEAF